MRRCLRAWALLAGLLLAIVAGPGSAQSLESALSPGPLTRSHAKADGSCSDCHVRFDRAGQDGRCLACHKEVAGDLRAKTGLHGKQPAQACRTCHVDHRGRDMNIAPLNTSLFDHRATNYLLRGKHTAVACKACHASAKDVPAKKYREAPHECIGCHLKDDKHKASLGKDCASCHAEQGWKDVKVDHEKTRFPLTGKHVNATCDSCHKSKVFKEVSSTCFGCHKKEDKHKARFGERCETCHTTRAWSGVTFKHDTDTKFALRGRHRETTCASCHTGHLFKDKLASDCVSCHKKDDKHKGSLGSECASCHGERSWKESVRFDHSKARFPLLGAHTKAECKACHTTPQFKEAPSDCAACHKKDDKHQGTLGTDCAGCHTERDWKASRFDHVRTQFQLRGSHAVPPLKCTDCHVDLRSFRPTAMECLACHKKDDQHAGQLGTRCETCHSSTSPDKGWRVTRFDHARARFPLAGSHVRVECKACHQSPRFRDAPRDCISCHKKDDKHQAALGTRCESCHNQRDWRLWTFDHGKQTSYALEGSHASVACKSCHDKPAPAGQAAAPLGRTCLSCHRRDDVHDGGFGTRCDQCHSVTRWKQVSHRGSP
jgi:hypothetical protein